MERRSRTEGRLAFREADIDMAAGTFQSPSIGRDNPAQAPSILEGLDGPPEANRGSTGMPRSTDLITAVKKPVV
jgi:hypothetical protein